MTRAKLLIFVLVLVALVEEMQTVPHTEVPAEGGAVEEKSETEAVVKDEVKAGDSEPGQTEAVVQDEEKAGASDGGQTEAVVKDAVKAGASEPGQTEAVVKDEEKAGASDGGQAAAVVKDEVKAGDSEPGQTEAVVKDAVKAGASDGEQAAAVVKDEVKAGASVGGQTKTEASSTQGPTQRTTTNLMDLLTYKDSEENGGYPFAHPRGPSPGFRHVKAHDGFHDVRREKQWAHWNDAFTTTLKPLQFS